MDSEDDVRRLQSLLPNLNLNDLDRLQFLYCSFRPRDLNPKGYEEKLRFWFDAIAQICCARNSSIINLQSLQKDLRIEDRVPQGLELVLSELRKEKKILPLWHDGSWSSWALNFAHSRVFSMKPTDSFIHIDTLNKLVEDVKMWVTDNLELDFQKWSYTRLKSPYIERDDIEPCLKRLEACGDIKIVKMDNGTEWIRINRNNNASVPEESEEKAILNLVLASEKVKMRLKELEEKEAFALSKTKELLQKGQKDRAKSQLIKTKRIRKNLIENDSVLDKIESLLDCVSASGSQREVIKSLKEGNKAIKSHHLSLEEVDEVMDEIKETLEMSKDISDALSSTEELDESLLAELEELEKEYMDANDSDLADAMNKLKIPDSLPKASDSPIKKRVLELS